MKTKVINLVGASGSGKTTVAKELEKTGYNVIQSYTTRPQREDGEWGHTFIDYHVSIEDAPDNIDLLCEKGFFKRSDMIAYFNSYNSGHHYFATDEQVVRGKSNIYIVDPAGAEQVHEYYKDTDVEVITIYLQVDRETRRKRLLNRGTPTLSQLRNGKTYIHQNLLKEISNRLSKDDEIFKTVKCDYVIDGNGDIKSIVDQFLSVC